MATHGRMPTGREAASAPMLRPARRLEEFTIGARDGDIGRVKDLHFDDQSWTVRALVVDTGTWLTGRQVIVSPAAVRDIDQDGGRLRTDLDRAKVEGSPGLEASRPVSRQHEVELYGYYGWPYYWMGPDRWGAAATPWETGSPAPPRPVSRPSGVRDPGGDPALRSTGEVRGYAIQARGGALGHVEDFLVEDASWAIRYLVVDPRSWWPGPHVIVSTEWITGVSWPDGHVAVDLTRDQVRDAPRYDAASPIERGWEDRLHAHYGRSGYWERPASAWRMYPPAA